MEGGGYAMPYEEMQVLSPETLANGIFQEMNPQKVRNQIVEVVSRRRQS